jgi:hypothetical protein
MKELTSVNRAKQVNTMQSPAIHILDPIDMTEELMFHIFNNDMNRELDGRWLDLYLSLQLYKEHLEKLEEE